MTPAFLMLTTTVGSTEDAKSLATALVAARLAACVQVLPIESTYRWQGEVERASEHLLICKIKAADYPEVEAEIRAKHAYEVPEIVAVPIVAGSSAYLGWLAESTALARHRVSNHEVQTAISWVRLVVRDAPAALLTMRHLAGLRPSSPGKTKRRRRCGTAVQERSAK